MNASICAFTVCTSEEGERRGRMGKCVPFISRDVRMRDWRLLYASHADIVEAGPAFAAVVEG